jgi:small GTP-binding protein
MPEAIFLKIGLLGSGGVGKTTLLHRITQNRFISDTPMTMGVEFFLVQTHFQIHGKDYPVIMMIWDFAGSNRFQFVIPNYMKKVDGVFLCYDMTRMRSLDSIGEWVQIARTESSEIPMMLIGFKSDREDDLVVNTNYAQEVANEHNIPQITEISSKTGHNINHAFEKMLELIIHQLKTPNTRVLKTDNLDLNRKVEEFHGVPLYADEFHVLQQLEELIHQKIPVQMSYETGKPGCKLWNRHVVSLKLEQISRLSRIPENIASLTHLESLSLTQMDLVEVPASIGYLKMLKFLDLNHNQLRWLPNTIGELKKLVSINVAFNKLTNLPPGILELNALTNFNGQENPWDYPFQPLEFRPRSFPVQRILQNIRNTLHILMEKIRTNQRLENQEFSFPYLLFYGRFLEEYCQIFPTRTAESFLRFLTERSLIEFNGTTLWL